MPVPMGTQGQPDFSQPIELMMDCHRRIEHFLRVLQGVTSGYSHQPLDEPAREALQTSLFYFRSAAPRHTADEEESLFPRMRACDDPAVREALAEVDALESDHRDAEVAHARVDQLGVIWLDAGVLPQGEMAELAGLLGTLADTYARHIRVEDDRIFPMAHQAIPAGAMDAIGQEMRQRRTDAPGRPGSRCAARRQSLATNVARPRSS